MSFEKEFRELVRNEVASEMAELRALLEEIKAQAGSLGALTQFAQRFAPLMGVQLPAGSRRRGRPPGSKNAVKAKGKAKAPGTGRRGPVPVNDRACSIIGCKRPSRTKGYCAAHYQKLRMLDRTKRLPADWVDFAPPHSVKDVVLPRGRAASKALKEAKAAARAS